MIGYKDRMFKLQSKSIQAWKAEHEKEDQNQEVERFRLKIWMDNLKRMEKHNEQFYKVDRWIVECTMH